MVAFYGGYDNTGKGVLYFLKAVYGSSWKTVEKRVTVVKFGGDKGISKDYSRGFV
jgi:hypothetical protein